MQDAGAECLQALAVFGGCIAHVMRKPVARILLIERPASVDHGQSWPGSMRQRSRLDRVASDDRAAWERQPRHLGAVDQCVLGNYLQRIDRSAHREQSRLQDVDRVDFIDARFGHRPGDRALADALGSARAGQASDLRIAQAVDSRLGSRITAAATTGPASGPRPASSMPQIKPGSLARSARISRQWP